MTHPKHQLAGWNPFKDIDRAVRSVIKSPALRVIADPAGVFRSGGPASIREVRARAEDFGREVVDLDIALHTAPVSAIAGESVNPFQNSPPAPVPVAPEPAPTPTPIAPQLWTASSGVPFPGPAPVAANPFQNSPPAPAPAPAPVAANPFQNSPPAPAPAPAPVAANPFQNSPPAPAPAPQPQPAPTPQSQPSPAPAPVVISPVVIPPSMNDAQPRPVPSSPPVITPQPAPTYGPPSGALYVADVSNVGAPGGGVAVSLPGASQAADTAAPNNAGKWLAALAAAVMFLN